MNIISPGRFMIQSEYPTSIVNNSMTDLMSKGTAYDFIIPGVYERDLVDWAGQFIAPHSHFVDIGAHIGSWTLLLAKQAQQVTAFEPQKMRYYQLCGNIAVNNLDNVTAVHCGLTSEETRGKKMTLYKFRNDSGSSTLRSDIAQRSFTETTPTGQELVELKCLDDFQLNNVSLMKIDVEGFELEVLKGAKQTLARCRPYIVLELWAKEWFKSSREETIEWLKSHGYHVENISNYPDYWLASPEK